MLAAALSTVLDIRITLALAFSLTTVAVVSLLSLSMVSGRRSTSPTSEVRFGGLKGDRVAFELDIGLRGIRWVRSHVAASVSGVLDGMAEIQEGSRIRVSMVPRYAGRFSGLKLSFDFNDPLRLFSKTAEVDYPDFTLDVLPRALTIPASVRRPPLLATGETPAGAPGLGQELYSIEAYRTSMDMRSIIWRRVAQSPEQDLFVRIRESNVPRRVRIGLIQAVERDQEKIPWLDLLCEGVATIGRELIGLGSDLRISYASEDGMRTHDVSDLKGLAEALMEFSGTPPDPVFAYVAEHSDVIVTGVRELEKYDLAGFVSRTPSLLIYERSLSFTPTERCVVFSGQESLLSLVAKVVER